MLEPTEEGKAVDADTQKLRDKEEHEIAVANKFVRLIYTKRVEEVKTLI